jgi:hypothetical protein
MSLEAYHKNPPEEQSFRKEPLEKNIKKKAALIFRAA